MREERKEKKKKKKDKKSKTDGARFFLCGSLTNPAGDAGLNGSGREREMNVTHRQRWEERGAQHEKSVNFYIGGPCRRVMKLKGFPQENGESKKKVTSLVGVAYKLSEDKCATCEE